MNAKYKDVRKKIVFAKKVFSPLKIVANKLLYNKKYLLGWNSNF